MNPDQILFLSILSLCFILFFWGKIRYDVVALGALLVSGLFNFVPPSKLFSGFGHPATMIVIFILLLSKGLTRSGAVEIIASILLKPFEKNPFIQKALLIILVCVLSGFMNNIGALAIMMPVAIHTLRKNNENPSSILMPLSFASILGGMMTLIGTPPNIIISTFREKTLAHPYGMFDFSYVGGGVAIGGVLFLIFFTRFFLKKRDTFWQKDLFEVESYVFEVKAEKESSLIKKTIQEIEELLTENGLLLLGMIHKKRYFTRPPLSHTLYVSDTLMVEGAQEDLDRFNFKYKTGVLSADNARDAILTTHGRILAEMVVGPNAAVDGRRVEQVRFQGHFDVQLLAISKDGNASVKGRLRKLFIHSGDVLLLYGEENNIDECAQSLGLLPLERRGMDMGKRKFAPLALGLFATSIFISAMGWASLPVMLGFALIAMVLSGVIPLKQMYKDIDWPVIMLLGCMIPLGFALETLGITILIAEGLTTQLGITNPVLLLGILMVLTMFLSDVLNNAATTILAAPIAMKIADTLNVSADPFLMAVCVGASCAFLTPVGHQNNALIMGPGGYKFSDYWKLGLPLQGLVLLLALPLLLFMWPW
jgi:di/tricarboxylate transporter